MIKAFQPRRPRINQHFKIPIDHRPARHVRARVAEIQLIAFACHGGGDIGEFTGVIQPVPVVLGHLFVEGQALLLQGFEAFFQRCAGEFAHDFLERAPRLPVTAPEVTIEHRFDPAQSDLGVPDQHQGLALFKLSFFDALPLERSPGHHHDRHHRDQRRSTIEKHQRLVDLVGQHDAVEIGGRQQYQRRNSAPEAGSIRVFHCWNPHDQREP